MMQEKKNIEKIEIENPIKAILIPRLHERKKYHSPKSYNKNNYLGNKRYYNNESESKKKKFK